MRRLFVGPFPTWLAFVGWRSGAALAIINAMWTFCRYRVACVERAVAAVVALAMIRRGVTWCHGVKARPVALHAWVEVDGVPVGEAADPRGTYHVLFTISEQGNQ